MKQALHREAEYDSRGFEMLARMQRDHFWYRGRHRFLLDSVRHFCSGHAKLRAVDLGGGCGGWISYLYRRSRDFVELALADSSEHALNLAKSGLPPGTSTCQIDLMDLPWKERWDVAFLLDVIEHLPDDAGALRQTYQALAPGGLAFVTVPALRIFWTWNDEAAHHQRRYSRADFQSLAQQTGFELVDTRYFMFFLSPLLIASRLMSRPNPKDDPWELQERMHRVPSPLVNGILSAVFCSESPIGRWIRFPWGTSALAVLRKPTATID